MSVYFEQFYLACLSHASYLLGSEGDAAVVDPQRDIEIYLAEAKKQGLTIRYVIETHLHADFVSGHRELAARSGAEICISAKANAAFPHRPIRDGDEITFGSCRLRFLETPGHSLDSITVVATDLERSTEPFAALTGDTLFIGDVGRPDLAEGKSAAEMARLLYRSLQDKILRLPDAIEIYPAHGAGSLCGKQLSEEKHSTLGRERQTNYALRVGSESEFVSIVTSDLPERPGYFSVDHEINRSGPALLDELPELAALAATEVSRQIRQGALFVDTRPAQQFAAGHIPGSVNIPLIGQFAMWAGAVIGTGIEVLLAAEDAARVREARLRLARVGIENVAGALRGGVAEWAAAGLPTEQTPQITVSELRRQLDENPEELQVVDVRRPPEWKEGHIEGAILMPLAELKEAIPRLERDKPVAVYCKGGYRSAIAASLLQRAGFQTLNTAGGYDAWRGLAATYHRASSG